MAQSGYLPWPPHALMVFLAGLAVADAFSSWVRAAGYQIFRRGGQGRLDAAWRNPPRALAGLEVVMDRCVKIEPARFFGGLSTLGLNAGVLSARKRGG
jgi:hypothetical protein